MSETEETFDMCCQRIADNMVGKEFAAETTKLIDKGYRLGKITTDRASGQSTVLITKGSHETRLQYKITFNWKEPYPGMNVPHVILACQWNPPLRPAPFEVR